MGYRARTHALVHALKYVQTLPMHSYMHKPEQESHSVLPGRHESLHCVTLVKTLEVMFSVYSASRTQKSQKCLQCDHIDAKRDGNYDLSPISKSVC